MWKSCCRLSSSNLYLYSMFWSGFCSVVDFFFCVVAPLVMCARIISVFTTSSCSAAEFSFILVVVVDSILHFIVAGPHWTIDARQTPFVAVAAVFMRIFLFISDESNWFSEYGDIYCWCFSILWFFLFFRRFLVSDVTEVIISFFALCATLFLWKAVN